MTSRISIILLISFSCVVQGEIFKWEDAEGNTHYGDKPSDNNSATQLDIAEPESKKPLQTEEDRDERRRRLADVLEEDRLKKKEEKKKVHEQQELHNEKCIQAKDQLKQYEDSGYLYNLDKEGNRVRMPDEYRTAVINDLRAQIKKNCSYKN
jgi:hypothetical protein